MDTPNLQRKLRQAGARQRRIDVLATAATVLALGAAAFLVMIVIDAVLALSPAMLIAVNVTVGVLAVAAVVFVARTWAAGRFDARHMARVVEERLGIRDSSLINAVEFSAIPGASPSAAGLSSMSLVNLAIGEGEQAAARADVGRTIDRLLLKRRAWMLAAAAGVIALTWLIAPRLFAMVVPRYVNPGAELPPFTLLDFEVTIDPARVHRNKPATITTQINGPLAGDEAWVVFRDGAERQRVPMLRTADGAFTLPIERATDSRTFYIDTESGRSAWHELNVLPTPLFEKVSVRYEYPAYTGWGAREHPLRDGQIRAIEGTRVTLSAESNLPLRHGRLAFTFSDGQDAKQIMMESSTHSSQAVVGSFVLRGSGEYRLTLVAADGTPSETDLMGHIVVDADGAPQVQVLEPDLRIIAPEGFKVPVTAAAWDDVAVERVVLQQRVNEQTPIENTLQDQARRGPRGGPYVGALDLAALGAKAGDTVRAFATAWDNQPPPGGARSGDSPTVEVRVVTMEEYSELARQQYGAQEMARELQAFNEQAADLRRQREQMIAALQEALSGTPQDAAALHKAMQEYAERSAALAEQMNRRASQPPLYDFEPPVQQALSEEAQRHAANASGSEEAAKQLEQMSPKALKEALAELERQQRADAAAQTQQQLTAEQMRKLAAAEKMMAEAEVIKQIARRQRELEQHLSTYQSAATQPMTAEQRQRLERLAEQQEQLRQQLDESLARLEAAARDAGSELPRMSASAAELAARMKQMGISADQQSAADQAMAGQGAGAHANADTAADKLESLIGQCNGIGECASDDLDGLFGLSNSSLANALSQMARGLRAGTGRGAGMSGMAGAAPGGSSQPGGSNPPTLVGPHSAAIAGQMQIDVQARSYGRVGDGASMTSEHTGPERLNPESNDLRDASGGGAGGQGVPAPYRGLAEQYFRRLATDSR